MGQSERDRAHNEEIMARERARAAEERASSQKFYGEMSSEIRRQERQTNAERAKKGGGCLVVLASTMIFATLGSALAELWA